MKNKPESLGGSIEFAASNLQELQHLQDLRNLDALADHVSDVALYLRKLAETFTLKAIAEYGGPEDKAKALEFLKDHADARFED